MNNVGFERKYKKKYDRRSYYPNKEPITSYGLILFYHAKNELLFLLYQRRDNFEYMDFIRGIWGSQSQLPSMFSAMSAEERNRIRNYTFEELWDDLWVEHNCRVYRDGFNRARKKYSEIKERIPILIDETISNVRGTPWGFPKGKKNYRETPYECALREFSEETRLSTTDIYRVREHPFVENFKGSNGKPYATHYFLVQIDDHVAPEKYKTPHCIRESTVSEEASNVEWFTYDEAMNVLSVQRQGILDEAVNFINENKR